MGSRSRYLFMPLALTKGVSGSKQTSSKCISFATQDPSGQQCKGRGGPSTRFHASFDSKIFRFLWLLIFFVPLNYGCFCCSVSKAWLFCRPWIWPAFLAFGDIRFPVRMWI